MQERLSFMYMALGGRIRRRDYWLYFVVPTLVLAAVTYEGGVLRTLVIIAILWPTIAVHAKRWHDQDFSTWWVLVLLVPVVGWAMALLMNGFAAGTRGENQYGPDPRTPAADGPAPATRRGRR